VVNACNSMKTCTFQTTLNDDIIEYWVIACFDDNLVLKINV
jgi:hypothetical protein